MVEYLLFVDRKEGDGAPIDHNFAGILEHDGDAPIDVGLYLAPPPIRAIRMAHDHTRLEKSVEIHDLEPGARKWALKARLHRWSARGSAMTLSALWVPLETALNF